MSICSSALIATPRQFFPDPHNADKDHVRLIDWQLWRIGIGTDDLAYTMALDWYPERRRVREKRAPEAVLL